MRLRSWCPTAVSKDTTAAVWQRPWAERIDRHLLIVVVVLATSVHDRDGAKTTLLSLRLNTVVRLVFADRSRSCSSPADSAD